MSDPLPPTSNEHRAGAAPLPISRSTTIEDLSAHAVVSENSVEFPGARRPDRSRTVDADGVRIAVNEWGSEDDRPLMLAHGGLDFSRTMDVFAPLLADAGWRVISWDHRGHGDSAWVPLTNINGDTRDAAYVLASIDGPSANKPLPLIGHSKGGMLSIRLSECLPHRFSHIVNIDGMPSRRAAPDVSNTERTRMLASDVNNWLENRKKIASGRRKPGTLAELANRRATMNPRLPKQWLSYLVTVGALHDEDGWRWKIDPMLRPGGFGPWRPEGALQSLAALPMPFLGLLGSGSEPMGWGTKLNELRPALPRHGRVEWLDGVGHFIHIERPGLVANMALEFIS
jgi:pimeloyl-ACP methyl ester carboxylesterase